MTFCRKIKNKNVFHFVCQLHPGTRYIYIYIYNKPTICTFRQNPEIFCHIGNTVMLRFLTSLQSYRKTTITCLYFIDSKEMLDGNKISCLVCLAAPQELLIQVYQLSKVLD